MHPSQRTAMAIASDMSSLIFAGTAPSRPEASCRALKPLKVSGIFATRLAVAALTCLRRSDMDPDIGCSFAAVYELSPSAAKLDGRASDYVSSGKAPSTADSTEAARRHRGAIRSSSRDALRREQEVAACC